MGGVGGAQPAMCFFGVCFVMRGWCVLFTRICYVSCLRCYVRFFFFAFFFVIDGCFIFFCVFFLFGIFLYEC